MEVRCSSSAQVLENELFSMAEHCLKYSPRDAIILVPAQASFLVESEIMRRCDLDGFLNLEVLSFERLTQRLLQLGGGRAKAVLDVQGQTMLARRIIRELGDQLEVIEPQTEGICQDVAQLVGSLKMEKLSFEQILELAGTQEGVSAAKLRDIAKIYEGMQRQQGDLLDDRELEEFAARQIGGLDYIAQRDIILHGFDLIPRLRMQTIVLLAMHAHSVCLLFETGEGIAYERQRGALDMLKATAQGMGIKLEVKQLKTPDEMGETALLGENLYRYPAQVFPGRPRDIEIVAATNKRQEISCVAEKILEATCERNLKMREVVVLAPADYASLIKDTFSQCGIPCFIEAKRPLIKNPLAVFLLSAIKLISEQWRLHDVLRHVKTGLICSRQEQDELMRYTREYGIKGYAFEKGFTRGPVAPEELRLRIFSCVLQKKARYLAGEDLRGLLAEYMRDWEIEQKLSELAGDLEEQGFLAEARFYDQVYERTCELLQQTEMLGERVSPQELAELLEIGMQSAEIAVVPPMTDEVLVGDVTHSIHFHKKLLIILGVNDGVLPQIAESGGLLNEYEMARIREQMPGFPDRLSFDDQKIYIKRAFSRADHLILTYQTQDGAPSHLIDRILRLFPALVVQSADEIPLRSAKAGRLGLAEELRARADGKQPKQKLVSSYLKQDEQSIVSLLPWISYANKPANLPPSLAEALYGPLKGSVSRIERYYTCPYRYFVDYGLRPLEVQEFEEQFADVGTYIHDIMDRLSREFESESIDWAQADDAQIKCAVNKAADEAMKGHNRGIFSEKRFAFMEKRLREEAALAARAARSQLCGTEVKVKASEMDFSGGELTLETAVGQLVLRGRIDRIDEAEIDGNTYIRVVDYKTMDKKFNLTDLYYGLAIQLVIYLMAVQSAYRAKGRDAIPVGGFYFSISMPYIHAQTGEEERMKAFKMNGFITENIPAVLAMDNKGTSYLNSMNAQIARDAEGNPFVKEMSNTFTDEQLGLVMEFVKKLVARAAEQIYGGEMKIHPVCKTASLACEKCDYHAICRYDEAYDANEPRLAEGIDKERFIKEIERNG